MNYTCPGCGLTFDPNGMATITCQCGYVHTVNKGHDAKSPVICHKCFSQLYWDGDSPVIKTPEGKIIKPKTTKGRE